MKKLKMLFLILTLPFFIGCVSNDTSSVSGDNLAVPYYSEDLRDEIDDSSQTSVLGINVRLPYLGDDDTDIVYKVSATFYYPSINEVFLKKDDDYNILPEDREFELWYDIIEDNSLSPLAVARIGDKITVKVYENDEVIYSEDVVLTAQNINDKILNVFIYQI
jgi:hypothetical protein